LEHRIEKEETAADIGFDEKVKRAIEKLAAVPGIEREVAETPSSPASIPSKG